MTNDLAELNVFYGELTTSRALVYARLPRPADRADWKLRGQIRGPRCQIAQTLPLSAPLVDLGPGPTLLAQALVPEPCFWSPDIPAIYDLTVELQSGARVVATTQRQIGLRSLGARGRNVLLAGKRWVIRGVTADATTAKELAEWHDAAAAYVCDGCDPKRLEEASQCGALGVVMIRQRGAEVVSLLRELSRYPAAAIAVLDDALPDDFNKSAVAPNLLIGEFRKTNEIADPARWAEFVVVAIDDCSAIELAIFQDKPVVAMRRLSKPVEMRAARAACDALQRDLAPLGQLAGYIV
jgi:glycosyl hydrolase family 2